MEDRGGVGVVGWKTGKVKKLQGGPLAAVSEGRGGVGCRCCRIQRFWPWASSVPPPSSTWSKCNLVVAFRAPAFGTFRANDFL